MCELRIHALVSLKCISSNVICCIYQQRMRGERDVSSWTTISMTHLPIMADDRQYSSLFLSDNIMPATEILHSPGSDHTMVDTPVPPYLGSDPPRDQEVEMAEEESQRLDDQLREKHAIRVYEETHPDLQQKQTGGREIAEYEATWTVSTFRPNWGVDKMRDNNPLTYWQ